MRLPTSSIGVAHRVNAAVNSSDGHDAHHCDDGQFRGQPAPSGDALCPHQLVGVTLDLGRDQRRSPERTDGGGHADEHGAEEPQPDVHTGQFAGAGHSSTPRRCGSRLATSATSTTTVAVTARNACERNCRQASHVTGCSPRCASFDEWAQRIPCRQAPALRDRGPTPSRPGRAPARWFAPRSVDWRSVCDSRMTV